jgi:peptidylprolyl isomerase
VRVAGAVVGRRGIARTTGRGAVALTAAVLLAACSGDPTGVQFQVIEDVTFAASLGIDLAAMTKLPTGVYIRDDVVGTGAVFGPGGNATVNYTGWLSNGTQFDMGTFSFPSAAGGRPIPGFEIGMDLMAVGGTRLMIIPPDLAYGAGGARDGTGAFVIPPGAIVIFAVELVAAS